MTSMRSVATAGSVSGSRLVTQNLLLGLDRGWMTGLWTVRAQRQGVLRPGEEEHRGAGEGPGRGVGSAGSCSGEAGCRPCKTWPLSLLQPPAPPTALLILQAHPQAPGPLHMPRRLPGTPFPTFTTWLSSYLCSKLQLESHCLWEACPDSLDWVRSGLWPLLAASTSTALARPWEQSLIRTVVPCYARPSTDALRMGLPWGRTW